MPAFIIRRLLQALAVMLAVGLISFSMFRFVGDPINQIVSIDATLEQRAELRLTLGLDDPMPVQFARYMVRVATGDFGTSYQLRQPVTRLIAERMPATLELAFASALFALLAGIPLGVYTALNRDSWLSKLFLTVSLVGISLPTFLIGILLIWLFGVELKWLPFPGRGETVKLGWWTTGLLTWDGLLHLIMPAITLGLFQMTLIMRLVRSEMMEVMRSDFIRFARARGLSGRAVHFGHALKNTLIPVITITGLQLGSIIAFALITEFVFQWPGMGILFLQAVLNVDIPIMAAYLMMIGFIFVVINLIVDLLYAMVDPRIRATLKAA